MSNTKSLNSHQLQAIKHSQGPLLIIAGAGTGKTTVITERIKYLISTGLAKPPEILALTFTQKAALEMEERVDQIMPLGVVQMWIYTFHAFCDLILKDEVLNIGLDSHYILMTQAESLMLLKKHLFKFNLDYFRPAGNPTKFLDGLLTHFNRLKDEDISPQDYLKHARVLKNSAKNTKENQLEVKKTHELALAFQKYEKLKIKNSLMDFSDLISNTLKLFRTRKNILRKYQQKFKYILVDEYQDTNIAQNELVCLLTGSKVNLTVVADDDQSIYKFRGSSVANVLQFKKIYPRTKIITLIKNYRSTQEILNRAYDLIQFNNPDRLEVKEKINKKLISARNISGKKIKFIFTNRVENEADLVVKEIKKLTSEKLSKSLPRMEKTYNYSDIAILVRANNHAEPFIRALLRANIPFQFLGPGRLFRQEEVKNLIAYLQVLYNFENNVAFFRVLSLPLFDISARDIAAVRNFAKKNNLSFFESAEKIDEILVTQKGKEKIKKVVKIIHNHLCLIPKQTAGQILYNFLDDSGMLKKFAASKTKKQEVEVVNIAKFFDKLKTYEAEHEDASVETVVDWINLKMEMGESPLATDIDWTQENKVNIVTTHSSKGLEFCVVFLVNLVSDRFPTRRRKEQIPLPDELVKEVLPEGDSHQQEERRLFYVGMTRAKDLLFFTSAKYYGEAKRIKKISPFVIEALGEKEVKKQGIASSDQLTIFDFKPAITASWAKPSSQSAKVAYLSFSQIEVFLRCPLQYKLKYLLRIPTPSFSAASFGTSLHQVLKDFYQIHQLHKKRHCNTANRGKQSRHPLSLRVQTKQSRIDKPSLSLLYKLLKKSWLSEGYNSKAHEKKMYAQAKNMLKNFFHKIYSPKDNPQVLEESFTVKVAPGLKVGGRIDRIDKLPNGKIEIIDYKTGKTKSQKEADKDLQISIYALSISGTKYAKTPDNVTFSFFYLKDCQKVSTARILKDIKITRELITRTAQEIQNSDFLPKPSMLCKFCPYKLLCPTWL